MSALLVGYARCSTDAQDLTAQRDALLGLGVEAERIYVDHGLTGTNRERPGLREALAACRAGDTMVVTKLDRLAGSLPDARAIADELTSRQISLSLGGSVYDPTDAVGRLLFNVLAMVAEFESDLIRLRTVEGMKVAKAKGRLKGKQPKLRRKQEAHLVSLVHSGEYTERGVRRRLGALRHAIGSLDSSLSDGGRVAAARSTVAGASTAQREDVVLDEQAFREFAPHARHGRRGRSPPTGDFDRVSSSGIIRCMTWTHGVPWETLTHAYGSASDVPALLDMLERDDEASRRAALIELGATVCHQGTRYEASRHVVAPLIEIVQRPGPRRAEIVSLITHLAVGYPEGWLSDGFDPAGLRAMDESAEDGEWKVDAIGAYDAVCAQSGALVSLLDDPDQDVQVEAAHALAFLPDVAASTLPRLIRWTEPDRLPTLVAAAALAMSLLHKAAPFDRSPLVERLTTDPSWVVRFPAAGLDAAAGSIDPPSARSHAALIDALTHERAGTERQPWNEGDLSGFAAVSLGRHYLDDRTLELVCDSLVTAPPLRRVTIVGVALHQLFPTGWPDVPGYARDLSSRQRTLVRALTHASPWYLGNAVLGNFSQLVIRYGLPGDPQSMARWLRGSDLNSCLPVGLRKQT